MSSLRLLASVLSRLPTARLATTVAQAAPISVLKLLPCAHSSQISTFGANRFLHTSFAAHSALADMIAQELKYEQSNYQRPEQVASGPPAPFTLSQKPGDTLMSLNRTLNDEEILVELMVNEQPVPTEEEEGSEVVFNVSVTKSGNALVFECSSDGNYVEVSHVSFEPKDGLQSESMYTGPVFDELDDALKGEFCKFLEDRGVNADLGEYLRHLVYDKEQQDYQDWLQKVHKFVST